MHHSINCEGQRPADPVTLDLALQEIVPLLLDPQHPLPTHLNLPYILDILACTTQLTVRANDLRIQSP